MEQSHYFNQRSVDQQYYFRINGFVDRIALPLRSVKGLFSAEYFDLGTRILLKYYNFGQKNGNITILDLGSGYGLVSSFLMSQYKKGIFPGIDLLNIDACDISELAVEVTRKNLSEYTGENIIYHVQQSDVLSDIYFSNKKYHIIITNPPFSAGKKVVKQFFQQAYDHLMPGGIIRVVVPTKKGAKSYLDWCREKFGPYSITIQAIEAGYRIWTIEKIVMSN